MILAVGYRVKSPNGIIFRKWITSILKDYMIQGYDVNKKRLEVLNKTVEIKTRMLASSLDFDEAYQNTLYPIQILTLSETKNQNDDLLTVIVLILLCISKVFMFNKLEG